MKRLYCLFIILALGFLFSTPCIAQSDSLVDCFPLSVGNQWVYHYAYIIYWMYLADDVVITDSGIASYTILDSIDLPDSIVWRFQERRTLHRTWTNQGNLDSESSTIDSAIFQLVELKQGKHELYRLVADPSIYWNSVIPFQRNMPDSAKMYRYFKIDSTGKTSFDLIDASDGVDLNVKVRQDIGLVFLYTHDMLYGEWHEYTQHKLLSQTLTGIYGNVSVNLPLTTSLAQNYPNPFNPSTTISYSLPKSSFVTIKIYNVLGQLINTLINERRAPGTYNVQFDASNLPSGVYYYRLNAGDYMDTKKMLVIK